MKNININKIKLRKVIEPTLEQHKSKFKAINHNVVNPTPDKLYEIEEMFRSTLWGCRSDTIKLI